jgi:cytochrome c oxidase subunit 2
MALLLALAIWVIAIVTVGLFLSGKWWFPEVISAHGDAVDQQFMITIIVVGVSFFLAQIALGYVVWRYRAKGSERAQYSHGNPKLEASWTILTAVVFIGIAIMGQRVWAQLQLNEAPPDSTVIEVTGQQFVWNFRYPGADGKFGRNDPKFYDDQSNPVGVDPKDPNGKDDITSVGMMAVPVGRPVNLILRSKDVTHDFFVPGLRFKQDAVPGMKISVHFTPTKEGRYEIACAELCGLGHHRMRAFMEVKSQAEFERWLKDRAEQ